MFMDIVTHRKTPALARFSLYQRNVISLDFQPIIGRFPIRCVFLENLTFTTFLSPLLTRVIV